MSEDYDKVPKFLCKLDSDDEFRERFLENPVAVLEEWGIPNSPAKNATEDERRLPEKGEIMKSFDEYRGLLSSLRDPFDHTWTLPIDE